MPHSIGKRSFAAMDSVERWVFAELQPESLPNHFVEPGVRCRANLSVCRGSIIRWTKARCGYKPEVVKFMVWCTCTMPS